MLVPVIPIAKSTGSRFRNSIEGLNQEIEIIIKETGEKEEQLVVSILQQSDIYCYNFRGIDCHELNLSCMFIGKDGQTAPRLLCSPNPWRFTRPLPLIPTHPPKLIKKMDLYFLKPLGAVISLLYSLQGALATK